MLLSVKHQLDFSWGYLHLSVLWYKTKLDARSDLRKDWCLFLFWSSACFLNNWDQLLFSYTFCVCFFGYKYRFLQSCKFVTLKVCVIQFWFENKLLRINCIIRVNLLCLIRSSSSRVLIIVKGFLNLPKITTQKHGSAILGFCLMTVCY